MKQLIAICFLLSLSQVIFAGSPDFDYLYPIPGTGKHSKYTTIILRPGILIEKHHHPVLKNTRIIGTESGSHSFDLAFSEGHRTVTLKVKNAFEPGEEVRVIFDRELLLLYGNYDQLFDYRFTISASKKYIYDFDYSHKDDQIILEKDPDSLPADFPVIDIQIPGESFDGEVFLTPTSSPYDLVILKENGIPEYATQELNGFITNLQLQQGYLTFAKISGPPVFLVLDSAYQVVDTIRVQNGLTTDTHDMILRDNGNAYVMSYDQEVVDMSQIVPGGHPQANITGLVIQEIDAADNVIFEWRSWDHFDILDGVHGGTDTLDFTVGSISYVHCNSIEIDIDGNLIISNNHMNEVTKINRVTGDILWRMGGKNNQFTFIGDFPYGFTAQHDARRRPNGNLTIFDNGFFHEQPFTRVVEYEVDEVNLTATLVREIISPIGVPSIRTGNAQSLPNGHLLIGWGRPDASGTFMVTEHDETDEIVFQLTTLQGSGFGYSYRAFKYPWRPQLVTSVIHPVFNESDFTIYPNPASENIMIDFGQSLSNPSRIEITDTTGRLLESIMVAKATSKLHLEKNWPSGIYLVSLISNGQRVTKKLLISN